MTPADVYARLDALLHFTPWVPHEAWGTQGDEDLSLERLLVVTGWDAQYRKDWTHWTP